MSKENENNITNLIKKIGFYRQEPDIEMQSKLNATKEEEAIKLKETEGLKKMLEEAGVRTLFSDLIEQKVVTNARIEEGSNYASCNSGSKYYSYYICLIFNQNQTGITVSDGPNFDFITISANFDNPTEGEKRKYISDSCWLPAKLNGDNKINTYKKSNRFYIGNILNIENYVAYKIGFPDHQFTKPSQSFE